MLFQFSKNNELNNLLEFNGVNYLITKQGIIEATNTSTLNPIRTIFSKTNCNDAFIDRENNFWVATTDEGIKVIPKMDIVNYNTNNSFLLNNQSYTLFNDKSNQQILVGQGNTVITAFNQNGEMSSQKVNLSGRVLDIKKDHQNDYWISTDGGVLLLDSLFNLKIEARNMSTKNIFEDRKRNIWMGRSTTVVAFIKDSIQLFKKNKSKLSFPSKIETMRTYAITENLDGTIFIGSTVGIYTYESEKDSILPFLENGLHIPYSILDFEVTPDPAIWASTSGDGVLKIKNDQIVQRWDKSNGLASENCKRLFVDGDTLWIATSEGINTLSISTGKIINWINKLDGLPANDINDIIIAGNQVWVATPKGLSNFPKKMSHHNSFPPTIEITSFKILEKDTTVLDSMVFNFNQNDVLIKFAGLAFRSKGNIRYKYRLTGINENWISTESRIVRYPSLNPGNYIFEVLAINEDGVESEEPAILNFKIRPPWWRTWWFMFLSTLAIGGIIIGLYYFRIQGIKEKEEKERALLMQVNELEQNALRLQMNPHFIYNTLNAIQYFLTVNDQKQAMLYLSRFAKLIRMIFEQSKLKEIALSEELEFLKLYLDLEKLRFDDKVEVVIEMQEGLEELSHDIKIPSLLLQPLLENAFKHGLVQKEGTGRVKVSFSLENNFLMCSIEDDGIGREESIKNEKTNNRNEASGINITQERLSMLNDFKNRDQDSRINLIDLKDSLGNPCGTRVDLKIRYAS